MELIPLMNFRLCEKSKSYVSKVVLTVVDTTIPPEEIEQCQQIADKIGVTLRVRPFES